MTSNLRPDVDADVVVRSWAPSATAGLNMLPLLALAMMPLGWWLTKGGVELRAREGLSKTVSVSLDCFKGFFVCFMLVEHSRAGANIPASASPALHNAHNLAHGLDMVCYSFAYGYVCYMAYLSSAVMRSDRDRWTRAARSALMVWVAGAINDIVYVWSREGPPSKWHVFEIFTGYSIYWDFLRTFPVMLGIMMLLRPLVDAAWEGDPDSRWQLKRAAAIGALFGLPLLACMVQAPECDVGWQRYLSYLVDCGHRNARSTRFPALPQLANFNVGLLLAMLVRAAEASTGIPSPDGDRAVQLAVVLALVVMTSLVYSGILVYRWDLEWERLDWFVFRRWPPTPGWLLGTMGLGFVTLSCCFLVTRTLQGLQATSVLAYIEHLGANVLLYLTLGNMINCVTSGPLDPHFGVSMPFACLLLQLFVTGFLHYLAKSSRK